MIWALVALAVLAAQYLVIDRWILRWKEVLDRKYGPEWPPGRSLWSLVREENRARRTR